MEHLTRHLVSQHLGRVVAQVEIDQHGHGAVQLTMERAPHITIPYTFAAADVQRIFGSAPTWKEMVVRLAVAQAHRLPLRDQITIARRAEALDLDKPPWVGDLSRLPYGGATHGLEPGDLMARRDGRACTHTRTGFCSRLKAALREAGCHAGPRALAKEFNLRSTGPRLSVRAARHWLSGLETPEQTQLHVLTAWLGVTGEWLRFGENASAPAAQSRERRLARADGADGESGNDNAESLEPALASPSERRTRDRRDPARRGRRADRSTALLVDYAVELQRTKGNDAASAFLSENAISGHIILRVLACAAFRRKPNCDIPISIRPSRRDHANAQ